MFIFTQFYPGAIGSWIQTLELGTISHLLYQLSFNYWPRQGDKHCLSFHNFILVPATSGSEPFNLDPLVTCSTNGATAVGLVKATNAVYLYTILSWHNWQLDPNPNLEPLVTCSTNCTTAGGLVKATDIGYLYTILSWHNWQLDPNPNLEPLVTCSTNCALTTGLVKVTDIVYLSTILSWCQQQLDRNPSTWIH